MDYGFLSIIPPALTILIAFLVKDVLVALFCGVMSAAIIVSGFSFLPTAAGYFASAIADNGTLLAMIFFMGPLMAYIQKAGGFNVFNSWAGKKVTTKRKATGAAWLLSSLGGIPSVDVGTYAAGMLSRPLTDQNKVPREKLGFILSSSGAMVQCVWPLSIWAVYYGSIINAATGLDGASVYVKTIPLQLIGWASIIGSGLWAFGLLPDFGKMKKAVKRAEETGELWNPGSNPLGTEEIENLAPEKSNNDPLTLILPYGIALGCAFYTYFVLGKMDLNMSFMVGMLVAIIYPLLRGYIKFKDIAPTYYAGFKSMAVALIILVFACAAAAAIKDVGFSNYIVNATSGILTGKMVPVIMLVLAGITAFATGTSAGTVAVIAPLGLALATSMDANITLTAATILAGSMWGDTTSPISDLAVKPAMGAGSDIMDMISCQTPYKICFLAFAVVGYVILSLVM